MKITDEQEGRMADNDFRPINGNRDNEKAADRALRLECLKLAVALIGNGRGNPLPVAETLANYVRDGIKTDRPSCPPRREGGEALPQAANECESAA